MGCNCGKNKKKFQDMVGAAQKNPQTQQIATPVKTPRQLRMEARAKRIEARNLRIKIRQEREKRIAEEAIKKSSQGNPSL